MIDVEELQEILDELVEKLLANPRGRIHKDWREGYIDAIFDIKSKCQEAEKAGDTAGDPTCQDCCQSPSR